MRTDTQTIARGEASRILQPQRVVARDDEKWRALWAAHAGPAVDAPAVDFGSRMVVAVFQGQQTSGGFATDIVGAREDERALVIDVDERTPPRGTLNPQLLVSPFHIVSVPRFDGEVRFEDAPLETVGGTVMVAANEPTTPIPARATAAAGAATRTLPVPTGSSTGLAPSTAGALAYLAGPLSGALMLIVERTSRSVRFHAWQALIGLGALGLAAFVSLGLAFLMLIVSPRGFSAMRWLAALSAVAWLVLWAICLVQAYQGRRWKMPFIGARAERLAERPTILRADAAS